MKQTESKTREVTATKKLKKMLVTFLLFPALLLALTACESSDDSASADGEGGNLTMWHIQTEVLIGEIIQDSIDRFQYENPGFTVTHVPIANDDYKTRIVVALGAGTQPDIFITWTGGGMLEYIEAGHIIPLTQYLRADNFYQYFMEAGIAQATVDGDIWAVPVENCSIAVVFYNRHAFANAGVSVPTTISELEDVMETFMEHGILPWAFANRERFVASFYFKYLVDRYGGSDVFNDAVNRRNNVTFEHPAFLWAGERMVDWSERGFFGEGFNALDGEAGALNQMFYEGLAAMRVDGTWSISRLFADGMTSDDIGIFPFPAADGGVGNPNNLVGTVGDTFYVISSNSPHPDQAFEVIRFLIDETAVEKRIEAGRLPPTRNARAGDPLNAQALELMLNAPNIQLWYDQYLPTALAEIHLNELQALVGLIITPEEYNRRMEAGAVAHIGPAR